MDLHEINYLLWDKLSDWASNSDDFDNGHVPNLLVEAAELYDLFDDIPELVEVRSQMFPFVNGSNDNGLEFIELVNKAITITD
jgi:hypothetical protein